MASYTSICIKYKWADQKKPFDAYCTKVHVQKQLKGNFTNNIKIDISISSFIYPIAKPVYKGRPREKVQVSLWAVGIYREVQIT